MKRVRGPGGRFLNKKELQEQQQKALPSLQTPTGGVSSKMAFGRNLCTESSTSHSPSTSSGISSVSNGSGMLAHQEHISFASANFLPSMNFRAENGGEKMAVDGVRHHTPVVRWTASTVGVLVPSLARSGVPVAIHPWLMMYLIYNNLLSLSVSYGACLRLTRWYLLRLNDWTQGRATCWYVVDTEIISCFLYQVM